MTDTLECPVSPMPASWHRGEVRLAGPAAPAAVGRGARRLRPHRRRPQRDALPPHRHGRLRPAPRPTLRAGQGRY